MNVSGGGGAGIGGIGIDLVDLARIGRLHRTYGEAFARRYCLPGERLERSGEALIQHLGGLFAAKEAVLKALGTGWAQGVGLRDVEIARSPGGAPRVLLHGAAIARAEALGITCIHLSITHDRGYAAAFAVLERGAQGLPG